MSTHQKKFFNKHNLELLVELLNLRSRFIYAKEDNQLSPKEMERLKEIPALLGMTDEEAQVEKNALMRIISKLQIQGQGVKGVRHDISKSDIEE